MTQPIPATASRLSLANHLALIQARYPYENAEALAGELGCRPNSLRRFAMKHGIVSLNWRERAGYTRAHRDRGANLEFFTHWSPVMAYVLGYLWADGCVVARRGQLSHLSLLCSTTDELLIVAIAQLLTAHFTIQHHGSYQGKEGYVTRPSSQIRIWSRPLAEQLVHLHGVLPRKSYQDPLFPDVPELYLPHFVRGHFDGDGSVSLTRIGVRLEFLASPRFLEGMRNQVVKATGVRSNAIGKRHSPRIVRTVWAAGADVRTLYHWMYPSASCLCLERKRAVLAKSFGHASL